MHHAHLEGGGTCTAVDSWFDDGEKVGKVNECCCRGFARHGKVKSEL